MQHSPTDSQTPRRRCDPHPLERPDPGLDRLDRTTRHRLTVHARDQELAPRRAQLGVLRRYALARIETLLETRRQLGIVLADAPARRAARGIDSLHPCPRRAKQPMHFPHRRHQSLPLRLRQRRQNRLGRLVRTAVHLRQLRQPPRRQPGAPRPFVVPPRPHGREPHRHQRLNQSTQIPGIQTEPAPQVAQVGPSGSDLEQHA